ncbi:hypothetical protein J6590_105499, partial [Homalodisca vitripennis]
MVCQPWGGRPTEENMETLNESVGQVIPYFERAHLVELNAANRISKGLSNQKWRVVLSTHFEVHYTLPFLTGSSYSDAIGGNTTVQSEMAAYNVLHNVYLKQPAISVWINLLRCGLRYSTLLSELFQMRLYDIIPCVMMALKFEKPRGLTSVGDNVRHAAAYVCWVIAKAFEPRFIEPYRDTLAENLLAVACFDRE